MGDDLTNLRVYKGNEQVYHGREGFLVDFFHKYSCLFNDLLIRVSFDEFQIGVLRELYVALTQLHSNCWACVQALRVLCFALDLTPTPLLFLHHFCTHSNAKNR